LPIVLTSNERHRAYLICARSQPSARAVEAARPHHRSDPQQDAADARTARGHTFIPNMSKQNRPTITAVVAAYQAERFIAEALESILTQTRPPDEVVVVDDGSTDGTARELERFADRVRIVRRPNGGCPAAFNTAFREARGDFVAMCGADDIWEPRKLEWQLEAIEAYPQADVFYGHAALVGTVEGEHMQPRESGLLDSTSFRDGLFRENYVCAPSIVIRRALFERLGPFVENFGADDYEYWFRCLRAGAHFYYDPRVLMRWRQHESNLSGQIDWMDECACQVRRWYEADISDRNLARSVLAPALFRSARRRVDDDRPQEARQTFREALRYARGGSASDNARALAWIAILSLPAHRRDQLGRTVVSWSRTIDNTLGIRQPRPS
jgi:glycosyltransferase involved in cell wall biosynthesis